MFHNVPGEYRTVIAENWFATESCILAGHFVMPKTGKKSRIILNAKYVKHLAAFVEGFGQNFMLTEGL